MGRVAYRYRLANHVGRVRTSLAKAITQAFSDVGITVVCEPEKLWPALGYWKDHRRDVMRWEGSISVWRHGKFSSVGICSWESMSSCLKGFSIWQDNFSYEVGATDEKVAPSERYVCEFEADKYHANAPRPSNAKTGNRMALSRKQHIEAHAIINELQAMETRAHSAGLTVTAHSINNAKNAAGWELAGDIVMAGKASRGQRAGEPQP